MRGSPPSGPGSCPGSAVAEQGVTGWWNHAAARRAPIDATAPDGRAVRGASVVAPRGLKRLFQLGRAVVALRLARISTAPDIVGKRRDRLCGQPPQLGVLTYKFGRRTRSEAQDVV